MSDLYLFAFESLFIEKNDVEALIVLEETMEISPEFPLFVSNVSSLLMDPSVFSVCANAGDGQRVATKSRSLRRLSTVRKKKWQKFFFLLLTVFGFSSFVDEMEVGL
jgi:hypothetical protein